MGYANGWVVEVEVEVEVEMRMVKGLDELGGLSYFSSCGEIRW